MKFIDSVNYLGVKFDESLNFESHINSVVSSSYYEIKKIAAIRKFLSIPQCEQLIHSFISSKLDYSNALYFGIKKQLILKLQRVQNAAMRLLLKLRKKAPVSSHFLEYHWLNIESRILFKVILIIFKCLHNMAPILLAKNLVIDDNSRGNTLKYWFHARTVDGKRAFAFYSPYLWNNLPLYIRRIHEIEPFKTTIKSFLFSNFLDYKQKVNSIVNII